MEYRFCIESTSDRPLQAAAERIIRAISGYADDVAFIVVATKMDDFLVKEESKCRRQAKESGQKVDDDVFESYARGELKKCLDCWETRTRDGRR